MRGAITGLMVLAAIPVAASAVPMEVRITGTIVNGYNSIGPVLGTPTPFLSGYGMEIRLFYDSYSMPPDTDPGPAAVYGFYEPGPVLQWMSGTLEINGVVVPLDLSGYARFSTGQAGADQDGAVGAFHLEAGDLRQEPYEFADNELLELTVLDHGQFSDANPFDPEANYDFASTPGPGTFDGLDGFQFGLRIAGDLFPGSPDPPRWGDGQYHVIEIFSVDDPRVQIMPVVVPLPAAGVAFVSALGLVTGFLRRRPVPLTPR